MHQRLLHNLCLILLFLFTGLQRVSSQVVINEICASNYSTIEGPRGEYADWIELYNAGSTTVDISGYGLTDDFTLPYKFRFGSGSVAPGSYVLIFSTGILNEYVVNHWEQVVDDDDDWRYFVGTSQADTNWRNPLFDDSSWPEDEGGFGFGDGDDNTVIPHCSSVFMRRHFNITNPSDVVKAILNIDYDDGFIAFLNGVEIARANMGPPGTRPAFDFYALDSHEANMFRGSDPDSFYIDPKLLKLALVAGDNVLAIQVHNDSPSSSDMTAIAFLEFGMRNQTSSYRHPHSWFKEPDMEAYETKFKLSMSGETISLLDSTGVLLDQVTFDHMQADHSMGRKPDGSANLVFFKSPSPAESNDTHTGYTGYCPVPVFTHQSGFYSSSFSLDASTTLSGATIRYTTDGSEPTSSSSSWNHSKTISTTTTVKARVYKSGYLPSDLVFNTYFKGQNLYLPVFSISTDPDNLWDYNDGIYVMGPNAQPNSPYKDANFWQDWEKPATIEYFDRDDNRIRSFNADIKIYGNYSRAKPQKSFEIKLNKEIESGSLDYQFLPDKPFLQKFDNFVLRNSGTDWNKVHFKDAFLERVMRSTHSGYLATEPVNVFLNGEYWGMYCIYENHDQHFMKENYDVGKDEMDYLLEGGSITTKLGSKSDFMSMVNYAVSTNPTSSSYYETIDEQLDLLNFTDYMIAQTYFHNQDWMGTWTNNIKIWRPNGGKWRYLLYDLDATVGYANASSSVNSINIARNPADQNYTSDLFDALLNNPVYKTYFINRYADLINTIFQPDSMEYWEDSFIDSMENDMPQHFAKWGGSMSNWDDELDDMEDYIDERPDKMRSILRSEMGMSSKVELTLKISPQGAGRIQMNTIVPTKYPWDGIYFNGNPVTITAIPNPGYEFDHWRSTVSISSNNSNQTLTRNFSSDDVITAYFSGNATAPQLFVSEFNYHSADNFDAGDWIELHNDGTVDLDLSGWSLEDEHNYHRFTFPVGTVLPVDGYLVVAENLNLFAAHFPQVSNFTGPLGFALDNSGDMIRITDWEHQPVVEFIYDDHSPWPTGADGDGYTCELSNPSGNLSDGNNWFAGCYGGSPGGPFVSVTSQISSSGNTTFCEGGMVHLAANYDPSYTYQWRIDGIEIFGAVTDSYDAGMNGLYTVLVTGTGCSQVSNAIAVQEIPLPVVNLGNDTLLQSGGTIVLDAGSGYSSYLWSDGSTNQSIVASAGSTYWVIVTDVYGCQGSDTIDIAIQVSVNYAGNGTEMYVYPNPAHSKVNYSFNSIGQQGKISLVDMQGRILFEKEVSSPAESHGSIDVSGFANGIYFLTFISENGMQQVRLTIDY